jgi:hypothetical protein
MNGNRIVVGFSVICAVLATGCASIVSKSKWPVTFRSNPGGAELIVRDAQGQEVHRGTTPATVTLKSAKGYFQAASYEFEVRMPGYEPVIGKVSGEINGWFFGNVVFGGLIGFLVVDPLTGAAFRLPKETVVDLLPVKAAAGDANEPSLYLIALNDVPDELRAKLERIN